MQNFGERQILIEHPHGYVGRSDQVEVHMRYAIFNLCTSTVLVPQFHGVATFYWRLRPLTREEVRRLRPWVRQPNPNNIRGAPQRHSPASGVHNGAHTHAWLISSCFSFHVLVNVCVRVCGRDHH